MRSAVCAAKSVVASAKLHLLGLAPIKKRLRTQMGAALGPGAHIAEKGDCARPGPWRSFRCAGRIVLCRDLRQICRLRKPSWFAAGSQERFASICSGDQIDEAAFRSIVAEIAPPTGTDKASIGRQIGDAVEQSGTETIFTHEMLHGSEPPAFPSAGREHGIRRLAAGATSDGACQAGAIWPGRRLRTGLGIGAREPAIRFSLTPVSRAWRPARPIAAAHRPGGLQRTGSRRLSRSPCWRLGKRICRASMTSTRSAPSGSASAMPRLAVFRRASAISQRCTKSVFIPKPRCCCALSKSRRARRKGALPNWWRCFRCPMSVSCWNFRTWRPARRLTSVWAPTASAAIFPPDADGLAATSLAEKLARHAQAQKAFLFLTPSGSAVFPGGRQSGACAFRLRPGAGRCPPFGVGFLPGFSAGASRGQGGGAF